MKIRRRNNQDERHILTAMIVDKTVLGRISSKWNRNMFRSRWANLIASWCVGFYNKYEKAPANQIESIYERWVEKTEDKELVNVVEKFLNSLSEEYEELEKESNSDYIIDMAGRYFVQVQLERLADNIQDQVASGGVEEAYGLVSSFNKIEMGVGEGIDVLQDKEAMKEAFRDKQEPLIIYPGALGDFFKDSLERDALIAFMGPEKRGKSFWLQDIAFRAITQRRKVAYFEAGDMSQNQVMRRFMTRAAVHPIFPGTIKYPTSIEIIRDGEEKEIIIDSDKKRFKRGLSWKKAKKACQRIMTKKIRTKQTYFKLSCHPNSTLGINTIKSILQDWERENWIPDIIIIDYADILDMTYRGMEGRECINETWKRLRGLSQTHHCLVVTATQADAASYKKDTISRSNFSDDKRKLAHITGMVGINATAEEKEQGVMRLNWVALREGEFSEYRCVYVVGCLALANPAIKSCFEKWKGKKDGL